MQKRSFLLLEILIGISILGLACVFLFSSPLGFLQKEKKQLEEMQKKRLYAKTIEEIRLKLFKNELQPVFGRTDKKLRFLPDEEIALEGFAGKKFKRCFYFQFDPQKMQKGNFGQHFSLLQLHLLICPDEELPETVSLKSLKKHKQLMQEAVFFIQQLSGKEDSKQTEDENF